MSAGRSASAGRYANIIRDDLFPEYERRWPGTGYRA
jgi:hypothetical protein